MKSLFFFTFSGGVPVLRAEALVLRDIQRCWGVAKFMEYGSDHEHKIHYLAQSLLGPSLLRLRKLQPSQTLSVFSVLHLLAQCMNIFSIVHEKGYVHRDIKPANLCIGMGPHCMASDAHSFTSYLQGTWGLWKQMSISCPYFDTFPFYSYLSLFFNL
jgi:hypothetical protein